MHSLPQSFCRLLQSRSGTVGIMFGLMAVPLFLAVGAGVDYTRAVQFRTALQNASDNAAIAGAAAYTTSDDSSTASSVATSYMNAQIARLPVNAGVTFTVSPVSGSNGNTVQVTAKGSTQNLITSLFIRSTGISVTATAQNPYVTFTASPGGPDNAAGFGSSAADTNTVYYYVVPPGGGLPAQSDLVKMFSNASGFNNPQSVTINVTGTQQIGIALENVTGGNVPSDYAYSSCTGSGRHQTCTTKYNTNQYGSSVGQTNWLYSQSNPPSLNTYTNASAYDNGKVSNCSLQVLNESKTETVGKTTEAYNYETGTYTNGEVAGQCFNSSTLPPNNVLTCGNVAGQNFEFAWNDMGGTTDDLDYNDAVFEISCGGSSSGATNGTGTGSSSSGVVLIN